ncbi:MAG: signal peptidase II [Coriobacteriia bacterium]|nr:signal peptidase II [Coriobacteriia bacterium]
MFQAIAVFWLLLDFVVKQAVVHFMELRESIPLWEGIFHLTSVRNTGAAFSLMQGQFWMFYIAMVFLALIVVWYWFSERPTHWMPVAGTALLVAGALGNTIDRLVSGAVVDMFDFRAINFAIFNVADIGITVGSVLFAVWLLFLSGQIKQSELFTSKRVALPDGATAEISTEPALLQDDPAEEIAPKLSLLERLELRLQKWETAIEDEESRE